MTENPTSPPLIEFQGVTKRFDTRTILNRIDLTIYEGQITTIIGKSGVGKSVFLKHIIGLLEPDEGTILFKGRPVASMNKAARREMKQEFSYMFQHNALFDSLTVFENIALPLQEKTRMSREEIRERVDLRIGQLELSDVRDKFPTQISGGMQKRVALGRALITDPKIVLFDEPTTGLDPIRKNAVFSMIAHYQKEFEFSAVIVSHDIPDVFYISDRVAIIDDAVILFEGTPVELERATSPSITQFIDGLERLKDELTGLDTRQQFLRKLREQRHLMRQGGDPYCFFLATLVNLDSIRKSVGHIALQRILAGHAGMFQQIFGDAGNVARYDRNRLVGLAPCTDLEDAIRLHQKLLDEISERQSIKMGKCPGDSCLYLEVLSSVILGDSREGLDDLVTRAGQAEQHVASIKCVE
ncbi:MAG TPA: ATP-binding cassette domain-containing protein [Desulfomicrobiaceae bacterium]|nr:ATP-binding cassette domain-containing protein [Desulfomicrobiaceae bacterium]